MGDIWVVMPVITPSLCAENLHLWKEHGYKIATLQSSPNPFHIPVADRQVHRWDAYAGYAFSVNYLIRNCVPAGCRVVIAAGEDVRPDPNHTAEEMEKKYLEIYPSQFGVIQPVGDDLGGEMEVCNSPIMGMEFCRQWNGGIGPFWMGYHHFYTDTELKHTTESSGILYQADWLTHYHDHWTRDGSQVETNEHHKAAKRQWLCDKATFDLRRSTGFPGHQPFWGGTTP